MIENFLKFNIFRSLSNEDISFEELQEKYRCGAILLDVRSPQEFAEGHLQGAMLIPDYEINRRKKEIMNYKNTTIVIYCSTGSRSKKVCRILKRWGFVDLYNLYGGLDNI